MAAKTVRPDQAGTRAVRRIAHDFIQKAARSLGRPQLSDEEVHDARKDLQKARAALRLLRVTLGERVYRRENAALRDAARTLNAARDAKVLAQALIRLRARTPALQHDGAVTELGQLLHTAQAEMQRELRGSEALDAPRHSLQQVARQARRWRVGKGGWSDLGPAFRRIYRGARRAMPAAETRPDEAALHEWRKRTKYMRYALQMLQPLRPQVLAPLIKQARSLSECLGEHHDLAMLALKAQDFARGNHLSTAALLGAIERRQARLATRAFISGGQLYGPKSGTLARQLGAYWYDWRRERRAAA